MKATFNRQHPLQEFVLTLTADTASESHTLYRLQKKFGGKVEDQTLTAYGRIAGRLLDWFKGAGGKGEWLPGKFQPWVGNAKPPYPPI